MSPPLPTGGLKFPIRTVEPNMAPSPRHHPETPTRMAWLIFSVFSFTLKLNPIHCSFHVTVPTKSRNRFTVVLLISKRHQRLFTAHCELRQKCCPITCPPPCSNSSAGSNSNGTLCCCFRSLSISWGRNQTRIKVRNFRQSYGSFTSGVN